MKDWHTAFATEVDISYYTSIHNLAPRLLVTDDAMLIRPIWFGSSQLSHVRQRLRHPRRRCQDRRPALHAAR